MGGPKLDSLLNVLDRTIETHDIYIQEKETHLDLLRKQLAEVKTPQEGYDLGMILFKEYKAYKCDSAIACLNRNIALAAQMNDTLREYESKLNLSHLLASSGMYMEAVDILRSIDRQQLRPQLLPLYYSCYDHVYGEASFYTQDTNSSGYYRSISDAYKDSIYTVELPGSDLYLSLRETHFRNGGNYEEALRVNDKRLAGIRFGTPEYAMIIFHRAIDYRQQGNVEEQKCNLVLSALSDIQSATKDHASLWMLAELLYGEGDIGRAYRYIRFSWDETMFYNARLRSQQSAGILSLIDNTYQALVEQKNRQLQSYLILISVLVLMLAVALVFIYRQMKKLSAARNNLEAANGQLKTLNEELKQMNLCLQSTNVDLSESNQIKEEYIGRFIKLCSTYIDKLDAYRRMVHKKITYGQTEELLRMTRSQDALDSELNDLYTNFDIAFLQLFPDFVSKFNELLVKEEAIVPKKGELLNTELRIFALIRLGISDSAQIADFLRYSLNTIYNYRAKVRNKAGGSRDDFEERVRQIR